jgi:N-acyl homoserine lactone hydrolase
VVGIDRAGYQTSAKRFPDRRVAPRVRSGLESRRLPLPQDLEEFVIRLSDVRRLNLGYYTLPATARWPGQKVAVCAYLLRYDGGLLLFDTGIGVGHAQAEREFGPIYRRGLKSELARAGVRISDISVIANCHLHLDHCGENPLFPGVPIFVQQKEVEALPWLDYALPRLIEFDGATLKFLEGEADIAPGLRIIPTPGHTPGHQSLLVETSRGRLLLAGQAFDVASDYARALFGLDVEMARLGSAVPPPPPWLTKLRELDVRRVLFAHDMLAWDSDDFLGRDVGPVSLRPASRFSRLRRRRS